MSNESLSPEQRGASVADIQRRATADEILARIVGDLRLLNKPWLDIDVDDRNSVISSWREKIVGEMEAYF